ncbi:30S ribosomal protein S6 [Candidatus Saccharibacteria bacterium RIFCSPHIGHO2_12_FULL_47_16b]|nr:MAG: 30S ribosomal protein S6 [Candidatus Saccharibacteria bacterium RIFCSPHIGHO2_12_FULL_47_16b]
MNARAAQTGAVQGDGEERNEAVQNGTANEYRSRQRSNVPVSTGGVGGSAVEQASAVRGSLNLYEVAVLFDPGLEIDMDKASGKVEKIITEAGAKISKADNWGKRKLAYKIKKHDFAVYVFYTVEAPPEAVGAIEKTLNITDEVIRFLITKPDLKAKAKAEALAKEKAAKAAERAASSGKEESEEE